MIEFFKPEEFAICADHTEISRINCEYANQKLEREGKVVFLDRGMHECSPTIKDERLHSVISSNFRNSYYKALLIDIKPIKKCEHPKGKISKVTQHLIHGMVLSPKTEDKFDLGYICECGTKVEPEIFKEIK